MAHPSDPSRYPLSFLRAIDHALTFGEIRIPCPAPAALRSQFYGLFKAFRAHGEGEKADALTILVEPDAIVIRSRDTTDAAKLVEAALASAAKPPEGW